MSTLLENKLRSSNISEIAEFMKVCKEYDICDSATLWNLIGATEQVKEPKEIKDEIEKVTRYSIGEQVYIDEHYTATVVNIPEDQKEVICCLDQYWAEPMDHKSPFLLRLNTLIEKDTVFMSSLFSKVTLLPWAEACDGKLYDRWFRVPYVIEMFGDPNIPDYRSMTDMYDLTFKGSLLTKNKNFWLCMIDSHNRSASRLGNVDSGWLMDQRKNSPRFASVYGNGTLYDSAPDEMIGVRPVFRIKNDKIGPFEAYESKN